MLIDDSVDLTVGIKKNKNVIVLDDDSVEKSIEAVVGEDQPRPVL